MLKKVTGRGGSKKELPCPSSPCQVGKSRIHLVDNARSCKHHQLPSSLLLSITEFLNSSAFGSIEPLRHRILAKFQADYRFCFFTACMALHCIASPRILHTTVYEPAEPPASHPLAII
jgi:hypothetical protein